MEYVYAALLLHKLKKPVDEEGINKILSATGVEIDESKVKSLIASLKDVDIDAELEKAVVGNVTASSAGANENLAGGNSEVEEKKEEKKEESAAGLSSLFG